MTPEMLPWWGWLLAAGAFFLIAQLIDTFWFVRPEWLQKWMVAIYGS
jgi:hypothetical protein